MANSQLHFFLDFSKAFDLVNHSLLLQKLSAYKLSDPSLKWFESYLSNRQQVISNGQVLSKYNTVLTGVPQGSVLRPILFLLFINDLPLCSTFSKSDLFADDSTIHYSDVSTTSIQHKLQFDLDQISAWCSRNKMHINISKTNAMLIGSRFRLLHSSGFNLSLNDTILKQVSSQKLLGVHIDNSLTWDIHIEKLCGSVAQRITLLSLLSKYLPRPSLVLYFTSYILPLFDYGCIIWGSTSTRNLDRLNKLLKRAARIILRADFYTPSSVLFSTLNWLTVEQRIIYHKVIMVYKSLNNLSPDYISDLLTYRSQTTNRQLRSTSNFNLHVPRFNTNYFQNSFQVSSALLWNNLPSEIRNAASLAIFKSSLRDFLCN